ASQPGQRWEEVGRVDEVVAFPLRNELRAVHDQRNVDAPFLERVDPLGGNATVQPSPQALLPLLVGPVVGSVVGSVVAGDDENRVVAEAEIVERLDDLPDVAVAVPDHSLELLARTGVL